MSLWLSKKLFITIVTCVICFIIFIYLINSSGRWSTSNNLRHSICISVRILSFKLDFLVILFQMLRLMKLCFAILSRNYFLYLKNQHLAVMGVTETVRWVSVINLSNGFKSYDKQKENPLHFFSSREQRCVRK